MAKIVWDQTGEKLYELKNKLYSIEDRELRRNASGCLDPTAYRAIKNIDKEDEKFHKLLHTIFYICENAGFHIEGRIVLVDDETGRVWR